MLTSYRRPFFVADGPYVGPPILFALGCAAGYIAVAVRRRPREVRERLASATLAGVVSVAAVLFMLRGWAFRSDDRIPIPGTGEMLSKRPDLVRDIEDVSHSEVPEPPYGSPPPSRPSRPGRTSWSHCWSRSWRSSRRGSMVAGGMAALCYPWKETVSTPAGPVYLEFGQANLLRQMGRNVAAGDLRLRGDRGPPGEAVAPAVSR